MALDERLLAMLRCPDSGGVLHLVSQSEEPSFLFCAESRLKYRIDENEIPILLLEEAESLSEGDVATLLANVEAGEGHGS